MAAVEVLIKESTPPTKGRKRWQHPEFGGFELRKDPAEIFGKVITVNNDIWMPAGSIEEAHQQALPGCAMRICSIWLACTVARYTATSTAIFRLTSQRCRASLTPTSKIKGGMERRWAHYINILDLIKYMHRSNSGFIDWGTVPALTPRGSAG
jgi:hypothetical protein